MRYTVSNSAAVITIDGVLQKTITAAPVTTGLQIYHGLAESFQIILVTDMHDEDAERWLSLEGLNKHACLITSNQYLDLSDFVTRRTQQIVTARNKGYHIDLVIEPSPEICAKISAMGYSVANFVHSAYALPEWRPDYEHKVKPWDELEAQIKKDILLKQQDTRLNDK